jgi:hypothetical protein
VDADAYNAGYEMMAALIDVTWLVWAIAGPIAVISLLASVLGFFAQAGGGEDGGDDDV